jgi:putative flippase GtrA
MKRFIPKNKKRIGRFALVGAISTAIDFSVLITLKMLGLPPVLANVCSTSFAFIFSFTANKKYTFKTTDTNIVREMVLFVTLTLIGLWGFQSAIIHVTLDPMTHILWGHKTLGLIASKLLATGVSLLWNYFTYSRIVFKHNSTDD